MNTGILAGLTANPLMLAKAAAQRQAIPRENLGAAAPSTWRGVLAGIQADVAKYAASQPQTFAELRARWENDPSGRLNELLSGVMGFAPLNMTVWHGSPHKFAPTKANPLGEFDSTKIGTGEGAQAYGHGHYLAENRVTGTSYREALKDKALAIKLGGQKYSSGDNPAADYVMLFADKGRKSNDALTEAFSSVDLNFSGKEADAMRAQLAQWMSDNSKLYKSNGVLYKVDLPDEHIANMLDWFKPQSQQPQAVQDALRQLGVFDAGAQGKAAYFELAKRASQPVEGILAGITRPDPAAASAVLQKAGVPGIRYLDQGSRAAGAGSQNFVVFDPNIARITGRQ